MKQFLFLCIAAVASLLSAQAQDNIIDEVIWVIGDDAVLRSDVENMRLQMQMEGQQTGGDPYCVIPEQMAIQKLYIHQAKLDSINIPESKVFQYVEARINYSIGRAGSKEKLEEYTGQSINALREEWRQMVREQEMMKEVQQNLVKSVKVTPAEVRTFYNRIPKDSLPFIPTTVDVEIITFEPVVSLDETDDIKRRLREYTEQVTSGQREFSTLARLYSEDAESAKRGGELGFQGKGSLVPEFAAVAFDLNDPKRVSRIVETEYGYHIIQLIEKRGDRINVRHILLRPKVSKEEIATTTLRMDSLRNDIVAGKFTFEESAFYLSHDKETRNNKGLMVNGIANPNYQQETERTGTSRFEMQELPAEVAKAVYGLNIGDISQPFTMINSKQKEVVAMVKLKSRIDGHKASLSEDYQELKSMVEGQKRMEVLNQWVDKKVSETYIRINDNWKNCDFQIKGWIRE
ncbi:peptidylprolyl isomerase [Bacteroidia bacterium]|nr:peptidylprolyl isomerase [Bacteroidia bacterium]